MQNKPFLHILGVFLQQNFVKIQKYFFWKFDSNGAETLPLKEFRTGDRYGSLGPMKKKLNVIYIISLGF
jgi:hypothetical protein